MKIFDMPDDQSCPACLVTGAEALTGLGVDALEISVLYVLHVLVLS